MTKEIEYTPRDNIIYNHRITQGVIDVIRYGGALGSTVFAFGKYAFDSTPNDFTPKEALVYAGALAVGGAILGIGKLASDVNKNRTLKKLDKIGQ
jgi:hypothetical protein